MKFSIYVNFYDCEVLTKEQFFKMRQKAIEEYDGSEEFKDWLDDNDYDISHATTAERKKLLTEFWEESGDDGEEWHKFTFKV